MERNAVRFLVDAMLYVQLIAAGLAGGLLAFVIPRGSGPGQDFLGLRRGQWAGIHSWLSLLLVATAALHLWLNRRWILQVARRLFGERWGLRLVQLTVGGVGLLALAWLVVWL